MAGTGPAGQDRAARVTAMLRERGWRLAVAESCTGGLLSHLLTEIPGSSACFLGGVIAYRDEVKIRLLGVRAETLDRFGAVSPEVAREMAEGARRLFGADLALAITGVAGPEPVGEQPVGRLYVALAAPSGTQVRHIAGGPHRTENKQIAAEAALAWLEAFLTGRLPPGEAVERVDP